jgi:hypothetical protein
VTLSGWRGHGIHPAVSSYINHYERSVGCTRHVTYVRADNVPSSRPWRSSGAREPRPSGPFGSSEWGNLPFWDHPARVTRVCPPSYSWLASGGKTRYGRLRPDVNQYLKWDGRLWKRPP